MFDDLKNNFDFFLRNRFHFSRKNFIEKNLQLRKRNIRENLYTKDVLQKYFKKNNKDIIKILDIGSKNWFYAAGEYKFFSGFSNNFFLDGVELDAYRLYSNFYNRFEVAKYHIRNLKNTNYIVGNLLDIKENYDYIIWFLPFVLLEPHEMWGLPRKYFYPEKLLQHAYNLLNPGGQLLIINQGEYEAKIQKELLDNLIISYKDLGLVTSKYFQYNHKRYAILVEK